MSKLKKLLKKDKSYKTFRSIVSKCNQLADFDNLTQELENMHKARKSRNLHLKSPSVKRIMEANAQANAFRSRTVEIMVNVQKAQRTLNAALERVETYISANFSNYILGRTQADRKNYLRNTLSSSYYRLADYERILDMCQEFVKDIDQFTWVAKSLMDGLSLQYSREIVHKPR